MPAQEECRGKRNNDPPKREFWPVARRGTAVMLNRLMGGTPRKSSELLKKELLELQAQVDAEQRELMRLQTAKKAEEAEEADRQAATVYRLHESQSDDSQSDAGQSDAGQSDDSQSDGDQSDDSQSDGGPSDGGPSDDSQSDGGQSDGGQSEESGSESERRYGWPPTLEERAAAINAAVWGTSRQQSHPEAEQVPQPRAPRPPEQHQPQMPVQASPHRAAAEAEYRAAMAAALEAAETAARLRLESESESDNERRDSDSWTPTLEEATKATERAAAINAAAWSASRQQHTQAQSPPQAARAAAAPARWFQPTEPPVQPQPQPQPQMPLQASPEGKEQEQARKERVVAVVTRWQQQNGPWLRTLLAALDAPELGAILGLCKSVCTKLPAGSEEAAVRRAYLRAIKRVHPDKVSAQAPAQERFAAAAIFDALREANERNESAAELPERRKMRPERRRRPS